MIVAVGASALGVAILGAFILTRSTTSTPEGWFVAPGRADRALQLAPSREGRVSATYLRRRGEQLESYAGLLVVQPGAKAVIAGELLGEAEATGKRVEVSVEVEGGLVREDTLWRGRGDEVEERERGRMLEQVKAPSGPLGPGRPARAQ